MPDTFTAITKPVQGDATKKTFADAVVDDLNFLYNRLAAIATLAIPNASFEADTDADNLPDQWTRTLYTGGSFSLTGAGLADTECRHGRRAIKFVSPGGASNGGGYIDTNDFIEVTPNLPLVVSFLHMATAAAMRNKVDILFFDGAQVAISTVSAYSSVANPTSWLAMNAYVSVPATARYFKIRLVGGENTTTVAGSAYFDNVEARQIRLPREVILTIAGNADWICPADVNVVEAILIGAGGNGGNGSTTVGAGGGGGGGYARATMNVTPGTVYSIVLGAPGSASTFNGLTANSGNNGAGGGGTSGGAGGTASGGQVNTTGAAGGNGSGSGSNPGGAGGYSPEFGARVPGGASPNPGRPGTNVKYGAGGMGGVGTSGSQGGAGADGMLILRF